MKNYVVILLLLSGISSVLCMETDDGSSDDAHAEASRLLGNHGGSMSELMASPELRNHLPPHAFHYRDLYEEQLEKVLSLNNATPNEIDQAKQELERRKNAYFEAMLGVPLSNQNVKFIVQTTRDDQQKGWFLRRRYNLFQLSSCFIVGTGVGAMSLAMILLFVLSDPRYDC